MYKVRQRLITEALKSMEAGAFQAFCDDYLRVRYSELSGLRRHGLTADGKTRPGTPDSICELPDGRIIAVQCSTESNYWAIPTQPELLPDWKPIKDLIKSAELKSCAKVFLCCSREIPTNQPLAKNKILEYASEHLQFAVVVVSVSEIVTAITDDPEKYRKLLIDHCPGLIEFLYMSEEAQAALLTQQAYEGSDLPFGFVKDLVAEALAKHPEISAGEVLDLAVLSARYERPSRYRVPLSAEEGVERSAGWQLFGGAPFGRLISITGPPKIGKSSLIRQLALQLALKSDGVVWYVCPRYNETDYQRGHELESDIITDILRAHYTESAVHEYREGRLRLQDLSQQHQLATIEPRIVVVDNAENLPDSTLGRIQEVCSYLATRSKDAISTAILVSSRSLRKYAPRFEEFRVPNWSEQEIQTLLILKGFEPRDPIEAYAKVVTAFSGGHPLVAIAIAHKCSTVVEIIEAQHQRGEALYDDQLTDEIEDLLFDQLLKDEDERELLLRSAVLFSPISLDLLEHLSEAISPRLSLPTRRIVRNQFNTIFEGHLPEHIVVADVFQKVALRNVQPERRKEIHSAAAKYLLTPRNGSLDAFRACDGIMYSVLAGKLGMALAFANKMLIDAIFLHWGDQEIEFVLERLWIIRTLEAPRDPAQLQMYLTSLFLITSLYRRTGMTQKADQAFVDYLKHLNDESLTQVLPNDVLVYLRLQAQMEFVWRSLHTSDYESVSKVIDVLPVSLSNWLLPFYTGVLGAVSIIAQLGTLQQVPWNFLLKVINTISPDYHELVPQLTTISIHVGVRHFDNADALLKGLASFSNTHPIGRALTFAALAERYAKENRGEDALTAVNEALESLEEAGVSSNSAARRVIVLKADVLYKLDRLSEASLLYKTITPEFTADYDDFDRAWCEYRAALIEKDPIAALPMFERSLEGFDANKHDHQKAIVLGEISLCYYIGGLQVLGLRKLESILDRYFVEQPSGYGRSVIIAVSAMSNIAYNVIPREDDYESEGGIRHIGLRRGVFASANILSDASPQYDRITAYSALAKCYKKFEATDDMMRCKNIIFATNVTVDIDTHFLVEAAAYGESSFVEIAKWHIRGLSIVLKNERGRELVLKFGQSLYVQWALADYRSIGIKALAILRILRDGARELGQLNGFSYEEKGAVMILLLVSLEELAVDPETVKSVGFCHGIVESRRNELPDWIRNRIYL